MCLNESLKFYKNGSLNFFKDHFATCHNAVNVSKRNVPPFVLDTSTNVQVIRGSFQLFLPWKRISPVRMVNKFKNTVPFVVSKTYLYYVVKRGLNCLYESGLSHKWENLYKIAATMRELVKTKDSLKASFSNVTQNCLIYLLNGRNKHAQQSMANALSANKC